MRDERDRGRPPGTLLSAILYGVEEEFLVENKVLNNGNVFELSGYLLDSASWLPLVMTISMSFIGGEKNRRSISLSLKLRPRGGSLRSPRIMRTSGSLSSTNWARTSSKPVLMRSPLESSKPMWGGQQKRGPSRGRPQAQGKEVEVRKKET